MRKSRDAIEPLVNKKQNEKWISRRELVLLSRWSSSNMKERQVQTTVSVKLSVRSVREVDNIIRGSVSRSWMELLLPARVRVLYPRPRLPVTLHIEILYHIVYTEFRTGERVSSKNIMRFTAAWHYVYSADYRCWLLLLVLPRPCNYGATGVSLQVIGNETTENGDGGKREKVPWRYRTYSQVAISIFTPYHASHARYSVEYHSLFDIMYGRLFATKPPQRISTSCDLGYLKCHLSSNIKSHDKFSFINNSNLHTCICIIDR